MPANFPRSFRKSYPVAVRGEGVFLYDAEGKRYLDFSGSAAVSFIGHGDREVARAMAEQAAAMEFAHTSQFSSAVAEEFAPELLEFAGEGFRGGAVYFTSSGSEAVETALKLARQYQVEIGEAERWRLISRQQAYHGATLGALAVSGNKRRREIYLPMMREPKQVRTPYCYRCPYDCNDCATKYAGELAAVLKRQWKKTAAFIFEPVSGATLGAAVPPAGYLQEVSELCARRGVLTIADEVMTGCGRTGRSFAVEHWQVKPDILVTAKGIASGYAPLGAVIATKRVVDAIANGSGAFVHGLTFNAHPVALAAGRMVLRRVRSELLVEAAEAKGIVMGAALKKLLSLPSVGNVRGIGLLWGVEFVADKRTKAPFPVERRFAEKVAAAARKLGVLVYPMQGCVNGDAGDHLLLAPPATMESVEIKWAVQQVGAAIQEVESEKA